MIRLEVFSDIACPWCFIGKRRLGRVLKATQRPVTVVFRAYELQPGLPAEGAPASEFYAAKFGSPRAMQAAFDRVSVQGKDEGIHFDFGKMRFAPNTRLAHRIIQLAARQNAQEPVVEALFRAHFEQGVNVGSQTEVIELLRREQHPLDLGRLRQELDAGEGEDEVENDQLDARRMGIRGVPCFIAQGKLGLSGAQPEEVFHAFLEEAAALDQGA
jgi:predicted DsbA family dithiol-disulfide isomerase